MAPVPIRAENPSQNAEAPANSHSRCAARASQEQQEGRAGGCDAEALHSSRSCVCHRLESGFGRWTTERWQRMGREAAERAHIDHLQGAIWPRAGAAGGVPGGGTCKEVASFDAFALQQHDYPWPIMPIRAGEGSTG